MALTISDDILLATRMTGRELSREVAVMLFRDDKLTLAQAARLADMSQLAFQHLLASRDIPLHYGAAEFQADLEALKANG